METAAVSNIGTILFADDVAIRTVCNVTIARAL